MKPHLWREFEYRSRDTLNGLLSRMQTTAALNDVNKAHITITIEGASESAHVTLSGTITRMVDDEAVDNELWPEPTGRPNTDYPPPLSDEEHRDVTALRPRL